MRETNKELVRVICGPASRKSTPLMLAKRFGGGEGREEGSTEKHNSSTDAFFPLTKFNFRSFLLFVRQAFSKIGPLPSVIIAKKKDPKKPGKYDKEQQSIGILTTVLSP